MEHLEEGSAKHERIRIDVKEKGVYFHKNDLKAHVGWLKLILWQLFGTYTFPVSVSDTYARQVFRCFVGHLERSLRSPIAYIRGDERQSPCCGKVRVPRHYHAVFAAAVRLEPIWVANTWIAIVGQRPSDCGADVRVYDPNQNGLAYCLKFIFRQDGDWDFRNLDLFLPDPGRLNARKRRRLFRHAQRVLQAKSEPTNKGIAASIMRSSSSDGAG